MRGDEHQEHLIDRAQSGELAPKERAALERHLVSCSVCSAQVSLARWFKRELAPRPRDAVLYQRAVEGAIQRMLRRSR